MVFDYVFTNNIRFNFVVKIVYFKEPNIKILTISLWCYWVVIIKCVEDWWKEGGSLWLCP
jgi:hypothetical protein